MTESLKGLAAALLAFALFSTHDAIIKELGGSYPVFQIIFFTMLFAFVPMSMMMLADKAVDNFRPRHPWLVLSRAGLAIIAMSCGFYAFTALPLAEAPTRMEDPGAILQPPGRLFANEDTARAMSREAPVGANVQRTARSDKRYSARAVNILYGSCRGHNHNRDYYHTNLDCHHNSIYYDDIYRFHNHDRRH